MNCTKIVSYVYKDVGKDKNICNSEKLVLSLVLYFARKNKSCFAKGETIAKSLGISESRVKNILTKLEKLKYIRRKRGYRCRFIYIHPESEYFKTHNLITKPSQVWKEDSAILSTQTVDNHVDKTKRCGTLLEDYTFNNIYRNYKNTDSQTCLDNNSLPLATDCDFYCDRHSQLIKKIAGKRKMHIPSEQMQEICFHVNYNISKNNTIKTVYSIINQALTLIMSNTWSKPRSMGFDEARREIKNEKTYIDKWNEQKALEMASCEMSSNFKTEEIMNRVVIHKYQV